MRKIILPETFTQGFRVQVMLKIEQELIDNADTFESGYLWDRL
jgi:hypothetical protein